MGYKVYYGTLTMDSSDIKYYTWNSRTLMYDTANPDDKNYLISPVLNLEGNAAGSFEADVPKTNSCWGSLQMMLGTVEVEEDGEIIWQGRITQINDDFDLNRHIYCEGELAYLNDCAVEIDWSQMYGLSVASGVMTYFPINYFFEYCHCNISTNGKYIEPVNWYNELSPLDQVDEHSGLVEVEASAADANIQAGDTVYKSGWEALKTDLIDGMLSKYEGNAFVKLRRKKSGSSYKRELVLIVLDPDSTTGGLVIGRGQVEKTSQTVEFGKNLTDINVERGLNDNLVTQAMAFGYETKGWWIFKSVKPIAANAMDDAAVTKYGVIQKAFSVDGVDSTSSSLLQAAQSSLPKNGEYKTVEAKAIDLYDAGESSDHLGFMKMTHIVSAPHGVDTWLLCTSATIPLDKPDRKEFCFGKTKKTLTSTQAGISSTSDKGYYMSRSASSYLDSTGTGSGSSGTG